MKITKVEYISEYKLKVEFSDGIVEIADFEKFIKNSLQPMTNQFKDNERFKKVYVDSGHLTWEDGQMDISSHSIYDGKFRQQKKGQINFQLPI